jgi:hypothetical protein
VRWPQSALQYLAPIERIARAKTLAGLLFCYGSEKEKGRENSQPFLSVQNVGLALFVRPVAAPVMPLVVVFRFEPAGSVPVSTFRPDPRVIYRYSWHCP